MKKVLFVAILFMMAVQVKAQLLAWNLNGKSGNEAVANSTYNHPNIQASELKRGSGITAATAGDSYASTFPINVDRDAAINASAYYEFTLTPKSGATVSLTTLDIILRIQTNAPPTYIWRYSKNGGVSFNDIGTARTWITNFNQNNGIQEPELDVSGVADLQNFNTPIVFRLYAWGGTSASSNNGFRIGKSLTITQNALAIGGTVKPVLSWNLLGAAGDEAKAGSTVNHTSIEASELIRGAGLTVAAAGGSYASVFPVSVDKNAAEAANAYYEFKLKTKGNAIVSLTTLDVILRIQTNGAASYVWRYSKDAGVTFNDIGTTRTWTTNFSQNNGIQEPTVDLSQIPALQNLNGEVIFRLYAWGGTASTGFRIGKSLTATHDALAIGAVIQQANTLPITLLSFSGKRTNNNIKLEWITSSEQNNAHFELYRVNADTKVLVGKVLSKGNAVTEQYYSFTDENPIKGHNYYQLKQVDHDGKSTESKVIQVNFDFNKSSLTIYNNASGQTAITTSVVKEGISHLKIVDINGRTVHQQTKYLNKGSNTFQLNLNGSGLFVASLTNGSEVVTSKFIRN